MPAARAFWAGRKAHQRARMRVRRGYRGCRGCRRVQAEKAASGAYGAAREAARGAQGAASGAQEAAGTPSLSRAPAECTPQEQEAEGAASGVPAKQRLQPKRALNDQMKILKDKKEKDEKKDKKEKGENTKAKKDKKPKTNKKRESKNETKDESAAACSDSSSNGWIHLPTCPTAPKVRVKEQDTESSDAEIPYAVAPLPQSSADSDSESRESSSQRREYQRCSSNHAQQPQGSASSVQRPFIDLLPDEPEYREARGRPRLAPKFLLSGFSELDQLALDVLDGHDVSALFMKHFEQWQAERKLDTRDPQYFLDTRTPDQRVGVEIMEVFRIFRTRIRDRQKEVTPALKSPAAWSKDGTSDRYNQFAEVQMYLNVHEGEARVWQDKPEQWIPFDAASGAALLDLNAATQGKWANRLTYRGTAIG